MLDMVMDVCAVVAVVAVVVAVIVVAVVVAVVVVAVAVVAVAVAAYKRPQVITVDYKMTFMPEVDMAVSHLLWCQWRAPS